MSGLESTKSAVERLQAMGTLHTTGDPEQGLDVVWMGLEWVPEEDDQVDSVLRDRGAHLLVTAERSAEITMHGQTEVIADQCARGAGVRIGIGSCIDSSLLSGSLSRSCEQRPVGERDPVSRIAPCNCSDIVHREPRRTCVWSAHGEWQPCRAAERPRRRWLLPAAPGGERASRPVSRVLSPPLRSRPAGRRSPAAGDGHPSTTPVARRLQRPDPGHGASNPGRRTVRPCSALLRAGFTWPAGHPTAGGLLPHHFTVAAAGPRLCHFCGTLLRVAPTGRYPAPCSVEPGLSSGDERPRPSGRLARRFYRRSSLEPSTHRAPLDAPASAAHLRRPFERADQHICSH